MFHLPVTKNQGLVSTHQHMASSILGIYRPAAWSGRSTTTCSQYLMVCSLKNEGMVIPNVTNVTNVTKCNYDNHPGYVTKAPAYTSHVLMVCSIDGQLGAWFTVALPRLFNKNWTITHALDVTHWFLILKYRGTW